MNTRVLVRRWTKRLRPSNVFHRLLMVLPMIVVTFGCEATDRIVYLDRGYGSEMSITCSVFEKFWRGMGTEESPAIRERPMTGDERQSILGLIQELEFDQGTSLPHPVFKLYIDSAQYCVNGLGVVTRDDQEESFSEDLYLLLWEVVFE